MNKQTPIHQWTHGGKYVLLIKCVNADMTSCNGFVWPESGPVEPMNWSRKPDCDSGGLFGWPWGIGIGSGKDPNSPTWLVFRAKPENVIHVDNKAKAVPGDDGELPEVVYCGDMVGAVMYCMDGRLAWVKQNYNNFASGDRSSAAANGECSSAAANGYESSAAASGYESSAAASGYRSSAAASGDESSAAANGDESSAAANGYRSSAAANGDCSSAAANGECGFAAANGDCGFAAASGYNSSAAASGECGFAFAEKRALAGNDGAIVIKWWDEKSRRYRFAFGEVGVSIEGGMWYIVRDGKLAKEE